MKQNQKLPQFTDKNSVVKFEFNNLSHVVLWSIRQSKGGNTVFWHTTMNSALIMKYLIGSEAKVHFAVDHYMSNMHRLYLCYTGNHLPAITRKFEKLGHALVRRDDGFIVFKLAQPVDAKQIREWKHSSELAKRQIEELFKPNRNQFHVELYNMLRDLGDEIRTANRKMDGSDRDVIGSKMMDWLVAAFEAYHQFSSFDAAAGQASRKRFIQCVGNISFLTDICGVQQVVDGKRMLRLGQLFSDIRGYMEKNSGDKAE
jgi:hypothetical protein